MTQTPTLRLFLLGILVLTMVACGGETKPIPGEQTKRLDAPSGLEATPEEIWETVRHIGGRNGWYFAQPLWRLRGMIDRAMGGPGLRRGRRHPRELRVGDGLDFWRVIALEPPHRMLLLAEMKTPGDALLDFNIRPAGAPVPAVGLEEMKVDVGALLGELLERYRRELHSCQHATEKVRRVP